MLLNVPNKPTAPQTSDSAEPAVLLVADGYQQLALKWVFEENGGLATEADYPYIGVTNFCNTTGPMVKFKKVPRSACIRVEQHVLPDCHGHGVAFAKCRRGPNSSWSCATFSQLLMRSR